MTDYNRFQTEKSYINDCDVNIPSRHFSVAKVKFTVGTDALTIDGFAIYEAGDYAQSAPALAAVPSSITSDTVTLTIPLYKGTAVIGLTTEGSVTATGDVDYENGEATITGDGTITVA